MSKYCIHCMAELGDMAVRCPKCNSSQNVEVSIHQLLPGSMLRERYYVGEALGEGGFGITYIGYDTVFQRKVAIKEYFPKSFVGRNNTASPQVYKNISKDRQVFVDKGLKRFLDEARILGKFQNNAGIVSVYDFFEENGTAYIVMEYLHGVTLKSYIEKNGCIPAENMVQLMIPLMKTLDEIHKNNLIHRDISPDNIMFVEGATNVKLLDFGAARDYSMADGVSMSILLKPGYAPEEQYRSKGKQGPWTDVYALCATMYKCITGIRPDEATDRMAEDEVKKPSELGVEISPQTEGVIMKGLSIYAKDRYTSIGEMLNDLNVHHESVFHMPAKEHTVAVGHDVEEEHTAAVGVCVEEDNTTTTSATVLKEEEQESDKKRTPIPKVFIIMITILALAIIGVGAYIIAKPDVKNEDLGNIDQQIEIGELFDVRTLIPEAEGEWTYKLKSENKEIAEISEDKDSEYIIKGIEKGETVVELKAECKTKRLITKYNGSIKLTVDISAKEKETVTNAVNGFNEQLSAARTTLAEIQNDASVNHAHFTFEENALVGSLNEFEAKINALERDKDIPEVTAYYNDVVAVSVTNLQTAYQKAVEIAAEEAQATTKKSTTKKTSSSPSTKKSETETKQNKSEPVNNQSSSTKATQKPVTKATPTPKPTQAATPKPTATPTPTQKATPAPTKNSLLPENDGRRPNRGNDIITDDR